MDNQSVSVLRNRNFTTVRWFSTRFVKILATHKMNTFPGPYPSISFSSLYLSSDVKVTAPLCIPSFAPSNNLPTHHWGIHHHRAEGFGGRAQPGVGIDAADCWSLGRFQGFDKLCAWFGRRSRNVDMRLQTSWGRRRSPITVHHQSAVCASTRGGCKRYSTIRFWGRDPVRRAHTARLRSEGTE